MLNQETQDTNAEQTPPTVSVAQARVTPDELAAALAAIEARRQAEASRLAGTIPIEEAVSSLHLDSTPDEIWAEVQAQRAKAEAERNQSFNPSLNPSFAAADAARREQLRLAQAAQQARQRTQAIKPRNRSNRGWPFGLIGPVIALTVLFQTGVIPQFWHYPSNPPMVKTASVHVAKLSKLALIPDGKEVYADSATLVQISKGKSPTQIIVDTNAGGNQWTVLNMDGHIYLRGYVLESDSLAPLQGKSLNVYNNDNSGELRGEETSQVTLRVDKTPLLNSGGNENFSEVTVPNFQPDADTTISKGR